MRAGLTARWPLQLSVVFLVVLPCGHGRQLVRGHSPQACSDACRHISCPPPPDRSCRNVVKAGFCNCCEICVPATGRLGDDCSLGCMSGFECDPETKKCEGIAKLRSLGKI
ncbi:uncharacterized protein LOC144111179 [Amblyomma americanum]